MSHRHKVRVQGRKVISPGLAALTTGQAICIVVLLASTMMLGNTASGDAQVVDPDNNLVESVIGSHDGASALTRVSSIAIDDSARVYIAQPQEQVIRVFDKQGQFVYEIGRDGEGPGEFRRPAYLYWRAGSLIVFDSHLQRISYFGSDGKYHYSLKIPPAGYIAPMLDGSILARPFVSRGAIATGDIGSLPLVRLHSEELRSDTVLVHSVQGESFAIDLDQVRGEFDSPYPDSEIWEDGGDGSSILLVERSVPRRPQVATFNVFRITATGDTIQRRAVEYTPQKLTTTQVNKFVDNWVAGAVESLRKVGMAVPRQEITKAVRQAVPIPAFHPPVSQVLSGRDGTVWLRREDLGRETVLWTILDEEMRDLGSLRLDHDAQLLAAERERVWILKKDNLDVPYLIQRKVLIQQVDS